jgi:eukaryotic-like serine/threonine-protein kinase
MSTAAGTRFGPYEVIEKIGSGGMGEVYRAKDTRLDREVALKVVSQRYLESGSASSTPSPAGSGTPPTAASRSRFQREARAASALNHPNICTIYDIGEQDGQPYLVMELLRGETLKQFMASHKISANEAIQFAQQAASALAAAHGRGIIHRDIKPANIFVVERGDGGHQVKILDFGLAKQQSGSKVGESTVQLGSDDMTATVADPGELTLTTPGSTIGTISYMSPEQARGETLDARSDIFSLGTVFYEMLTGASPCAGASTAEVFASLLMKAPAPPSTLNPNLPPGIDAIMAKLLAKDRDDRYASAAEFRAALDTLSGGPPSGSSTTTTAARAVPPPPPAAVPKEKSKSGLYSAVIVLLLAALALAVYFGWRRSGSGGPTESVTGTAAPGAGTAAMKDSIILADFVNNTGDPVFNTTLNQALAIKLQQSPMLTILSQQHLRQSMKYLGKSPEDPLTPAIAREIGEREGVKAILTGTIGKLGSQYIITLAAQATATGDDIASEQAEAPDKEHVLEALDKAATAMRARLGESLGSIQKLDTPLGQATTPSLEAFRAYALGDVEHDKGLDFPQAAEHYRQALSLDPKFAMAWARLGVVYGNAGQTGKALDYYTKAYNLSANVSESERLYIAGHYYMNVLGDVQKMIEVLELSIKTYPKDFNSYVNISVAYVVIGQIEKALEWASKAASMQPEDVIAQENVAQDLLILDRYDEAQKTIALTRKLGIADATSFQQLVYQYGFLTGNPQEMSSAITASDGRPDAYQMDAQVAAADEFQGKYRDAGIAWAKAAREAAAQKAGDAQASYMLFALSGRGLAGMCDGVDKGVKEALAIDKTKPTLRQAAYTAAICGDKKTATRIIEDLVKQYPSDTVIQQITAPQTLALIALDENKPDEALHELEINRPYDLAGPGAYLRGLAYLQAGQSVDAIKAFQQALKYRGAPLLQTFQNYPQAELGLARAYVKAGNKDEAKKAYQSLFTTWKNADQDLPQLVEAKKEFAAL